MKKLNNKGFALLAIMGIFLMLGIAGSQLTVPKNLIYSGISFNGKSIELIVPADFAPLVNNRAEYTVTPILSGKYTIALVYMHPTKPIITFIVSQRCPVFLAASMEFREETKFWKYVNGEPWPCSEKEFMAFVRISNDPCRKSVKL